MTTHLEGYFEHREYAFDRHVQVIYPRQQMRRVQGERKRLITLINPSFVGAGRNLIPTGVINTYNLNFDGKTKF